MGKLHPQRPFQPPVRQDATSPDTQGFQAQSSLAVPRYGRSIPRGISSQAVAGRRRKLRSYHPLVAIVGLFIALSVPKAKADPTPLSCDGKPADHHAQRALSLAAEAHSLDRWDDPTPAKAPEKFAWRSHKRCLLDPDRRERIAKQIDELQRRFEHYRARRLVTPFAGGGQWWSVPWPIVECESRGDYRARNSVSTAGGAYQIIDSTWANYGGADYADSHPAAVAPPREQDFVAHRIYAAEGSSPWECG